jgi:hypothetical protein
VSTDHHVQGEGERVHGVPSRNGDGSQVERVFAPILFFGYPEKTLIQKPAPKGKSRGCVGGNSHAIDRIRQLADVDISSRN